MHYDQSWKSNLGIFKLHSGTSYHLAYEKWYLKNLQKLDSLVEFIAVKDDHSILANYMGEIESIDNRNVPLTIKNVLYTPELHDNLLSVKKLTNSGVKLL